MAEHERWIVGLDPAGADGGCVVAGTVVDGTLTVRDVWPLRPAHDHDRCTAACNEHHTFRVGCVQYRNDLVRTCAAIAVGLCPTCRHVAHTAAGCAVCIATTDGAPCTVDATGDDLMPSYDPPVPPDGRDLVCGAGGTLDVVLRTVRLMAGPLCFLGGAWIGIRLERAHKAGR